MQWKVASKIDQTQIDKFPEIDPVVLQLMHNRGLTTQGEIDEFFNPDFSQDIHDPYLFKQMQPAVNRIIQAHTRQELVCIYGDYDADGVCGTAILSSVFDELDVTYTTYIPHRDKEGYGLNNQAIDKLAKQNVNLIITVDCGISNFQQVKYAADKYGIDVIVTDHHDLPNDLPPAVACIHSRLKKETYPFKLLSGGGTAYKLAQALLQEKYFGLDESQIEYTQKWLLDMVALSTVGDIMPLIGENRTLVKYGLIVLQKTKRIGLQQLYQIAGIDAASINTNTVGWQIVPRINSAGRISHAKLAYDLLTTQNIEQAIKLAHQLDSGNKERQKITEDNFNTADKQAQQQLEQEDEPTVLVVFDKHWSPGVLGLVAGKLVRRYNRPAYALTQLDGSYVGSGRSISQFDVTLALREHDDLLVKYGGHPAACGLTIQKKNFKAFNKQIKEYAVQQLAQVDISPVIDVEAEIEFELFNWDLFEQIDKFEPFGEGNPQPNFVMRDLEVVDWQTVGSDDQHLRLFFKKNGHTKKAIAFGLGEWAADLKLGVRVDVVCTIGVNEWNGNRELQMTVEDMRILK